LDKLNTLGYSERTGEKSRVMSVNSLRVLGVPDLLDIFAGFSHHPFMVNSSFYARVSVTKVADKSWENARIIRLGVEKILVCSAGQCKGTLRVLVSSNSSLPAFLESIGSIAIL
jgi:hypothetical protein